MPSSAVTTQNPRTGRGESRKQVGAAGRDASSGPVRQGPDEPDQPLRASLAALARGRFMLRHLLFGAVAAVGFYLLTSSLSAFDNFRLGEIALYTIALAGLSLLTGTNGQISLGQGAFMAVGAYTLGVLIDHTSWPIDVDVLAAIVLSGALGVVVGIPATRLKGPYLAGMTLILALALPRSPTSTRPSSGATRD